MSEVKDPRIKLFGKTIQLPETGGSPPLPSDSSSPEDTNLEEKESHKNLTGSKQEHSEEEDQAKPVTTEELKDSNASPSVIEDSNAPSKPEEDQSEASNSQEKTLKKPDKILPCPRCNSMETKFCYFNNYNVNQPRHFCKNCQRYWTAGGTMRNVPVGAGRRKNKNSISQFRNIVVPEAIPNARVDLPNGIHRSALNSNGTVLTFSSDSPLRESMASVLNSIDKTIRSNAPEEQAGSSVSHACKESEGDHRNGSSVSAASSKDDVRKSGLPELIPCSLPFPPQLPCFPAGPWPYPVQWSSHASPPTFSPGGFAMPFYSAAQPFWGCTVPGAWNVIPPAPPTSGPNSPTLGKHSRDDSAVKENTKEEETPKESNRLWVPKTLRIDDPEEAAKSSIWATLGIKNNKSDSNGGLFKPFQTPSKGDEKIRVPETAEVLQANPAALSRSLSFHESS